jgi:hypothetical protein
MIPHISSCEDIFKPQEIGNALYGLQGMKSDNADVQRILQAMIPHIKSCKEIFIPQNIGNALYGLQGMDSDNIEVQGILQAMIPHIKSCKEIFKPQNIGNALYGLKCMNGDNVDVQRILQAMIPHIKSCKEIFKSQEIGNALYGRIQGMKSDNAEVQGILQAMMPHIKSCKDMYSTLEFEQCFFGMSFVFSVNHYCTSIILDLLFQKLDIYLYSRHIDILSYFDICRVERGISIFEYKQFNKISIPLKRSIENIKSKISNYKIKHNLKSKNTTYISGYKEELVRKYIQKVLKDKDHIDIQSNIDIDGFELDILLQNKDNNKQINIEVDGPSHDIKNKRSFIKIRDELLRNKHNIEIIRIPLLINGRYQTEDELRIYTFKILQNHSLI